MPSKEQNSMEQDNVQESSLIKPSNSRRQFFKKASVGSALIASAAGQPVWGSCVSSISGNLSGNLSSHQAETNVYPGRKPHYYRNKAYNPYRHSQTQLRHSSSNVIPKKGIHISGLGKTLTYRSTFQSLFSSYTGSRNTIQYILVTGNNDNEQFEQYFVTAVLNCQTMSGYPYSYAELDQFLTLVESGQLSKSDASRILSYLVEGTSGNPNQHCNY